MGRPFLLLPRAGLRVAAGLLAAAGFLTGVAPTLPLAAARRVTAADWRASRESHDGSGKQVPFLVGTYELGENNICVFLDGDVTRTAYGLGCSQRCVRPAHVGEWDGHEFSTDDCTTTPPTHWVSVLTQSAQRLVLLGGGEDAASDDFTRDWWANGVNGPFYAGGNRTGGTSNALLPYQWTSASILARAGFQTFFWAAGADWPTKGLAFNLANGIELGAPWLDGRYPDPHGHPDHALPVEQVGGLCIDFECQVKTIKVGTRKDAVIAMFYGDGWEAAASQYSHYVHEQEWDLRFALPASFDLPGAAGDCNASVPGVALHLRDGTVVTPSAAGTSSVSTLSLVTDSGCLVYDFETSYSAGSFRQVMADRGYDKLEDVTGQFPDDNVGGPRHSWKNDIDIEVRAVAVDGAYWKLVIRYVFALRKPGHADVVSQKFGYVFYDPDVCAKAKGDGTGCFGERLVQSLTSAERVVGQLGGSEAELAQKARENVGTIAIMGGVLLAALLGCAATSLAHYRHKARVKREVHTLARNLPRRRARKLSFSVSVQKKIAAHADASVESLTGPRHSRLVSAESMRSIEGRRIDPTSLSVSVGSRSESMRDVIEMLCREFWETEHVSALRTAAAAAAAPETSTVGSNFNPATGAFNPDRGDTDGGGATTTTTAAAVDVEKARQKLLKEQAFERKTCARICTRFVRRLRIEHEWIAPCTITSQDSHFSGAARIALLTLTVLFQMAVEALMYDVRNPGTTGTCALQELVTTNTTNTYDGRGDNVTTVATDSNFPTAAPELALPERIGVALVACLFTVPLAALCFSLLMKLAVAHKNVRLWERFGTQQVYYGLHTIQLAKGGGSLTVTDSCAFLTTGQGKQFTLTSATEVDVVDEVGEKTATATGNNLEAGRSLDVMTRRVRVSHQRGHITVAATQAAVRRLRRTIHHLPQHKEALAAAESAAVCRLKHIKRFEKQYKNRPLDALDSPISCAAHRTCLGALRTVCADLAQHSEQQLAVMSQYRRRLETKGGDSRHAAGPASGEIFAQPDASFKRRMREQLIDTADHHQIVIEHEEDAAGSQLRPGCHWNGCCRLVFRLTVLADRRDVASSQTMHDCQKWCIYIAMAVVSALSAFYVVLFGFCHSQEATHEWMRSLAAQLALSAVLVRPFTILMLSAVLPTASIEAGFLHFRETQRQLEGRLTPAVSIELRGNHRSNPIHEAEEFHDCERTVAL